MQPGSKSNSNRKFEFVGKLMNILLPLLTGFAVAFYISGIFSYELVIGASLNGTHVGYVQSGSALTHAKLALEEEIAQSADVAYDIDAKISYEFKLVKDPKYLSEADCYDVLWDLVEDEFTTAYMLYVDDRQAAAYESGEELEALISGIESDLLESGGNEFSRVDINNTLRIEKQLCLKSMLKSIDEINVLLNPLAEEKMEEQPALLSSVEDEPVIMRVSAFTSAAPGEIDEAKLYDPDIDYGVNRSAGDLEGALGNTDLILDYNFVNTVTKTETIYYKTQYIDDYDNFIGTNTEVTAGSNGSKVVTYELSYDADGNLIGRTAVNERIITEVVDRIVMVGAAEIPEAVPTGTFIWPCEAPKGISSGYGWRTAYGVTEFHLGIDLPDKKNSPIYASDGGEVIWAGYTPSYGYSIRIKHADDFITLYAHLNEMLVSVGDHVYQGQQIAKMGNTGVSYGSHLHFEVRIGSLTYDPVKYLPKREG